MPGWRNWQKTSCALRASTNLVLGMIDYKVGSSSVNIYARVAKLVDALP